MANTKYINNSEIMAAASVGLKSMAKPDKQPQKKNQHKKEFICTTVSVEMITGLIAHIKTL